MERSDAPAYEVEKQLGCLWLGRSQTSNADFVGKRVGIVVARTIRRLPASEREDSNLVVAMRGTPVAGRPADAAAGDAPTMTRHAVKQREVIVVPASSGAPLQAGSGEGVSASNPVPNLPKPTVPRAQPSSAAVESSHHTSGERELTVLVLVVTCLWRGGTSSGTDNEVTRSTGGAR